MPDSHGNFNVQDRMNRIITILAVHQQNVNADDGDKFLSDPNLAIQAIEDVTFAGSDFDLELRQREGWFGNHV